MYESLQILTTFLLAIVIGDIVYGTIVNLLVRAFDRELSKEMVGLFQVGLALIGSVDLFGAGAVASGFLLCLVAVLLDLLETFSKW
jgi:hypothetical protein